MEHGNTYMVVYIYSGQRRSAVSAQVSGEQVPEMDCSMALMATEEGAAGHGTSI